MNLETLADRAGRRAPRLWTAAAAVLVLVGLNVVRLRLRAAALARQAEDARLSSTLDDSTEALDENQSLRDERLRDVAKFKAGLAGLTKSRRALYEGGLELQEEKRLLEKQLDIMTTYLLVDVQAKKISLMRGEQALETYPIGIDAPKAFGGEAAALPALTTIVSKERFAHPERGKSEQGPDGRLEWVPPQVGTSVRANALGQYVLFTRGPLILHGPPRKPEEHAAFAHDCLELSLAVARRLYSQTYIGTRILIKPDAKAATSLARRASKK